MSKIRQIGCEEALKQLLEYLDQELGEQHSHEVDQHLSTCRSCYSRMEFEKRLKQRLQDAGRQEVPDTLKDRINRLFAEQNKN
ncbi:MAG: zf-HC2 domain-containing protein [Thiogranum sp.]|nr:zf-HC2 domain-containing protein [Thiogranum sp.]